MLFADRGRRGPDRYLQWKVAALGVGAALLLFGIKLEAGWLVWAAIAVLGLGFVLRFLPQRDQDDDTPVDDA